MAGILTAGLSMLNGEWWKTSLTWVAAAVAAVAVFLALNLWARVRRRRQHQVDHVVRLAADISAVASSIEDDLRQAGRNERFPHLGARCRECRGRAEQVLAQQYRVARLPADERDIWLEQLHDDHRRIVDLRSETDSAMASTDSSWPAGKRACKFAPGLRTQRSRWPSSGFHTRPSTLM